MYVTAKYKQWRKKRFAVTMVYEGFVPLPKRGSGIQDANGLESLLPYITRQT